MNLRAAIALILAFSSAISSTSCFFRKAKAAPPAAVPPSPRPQPRESKPVPEKAGQEGGPQPAPSRPTQSHIPPATQTAPQLGQILSAQERQQYEIAIRAALDRARGGLATVQSKRLTSTQSETATRIRNFIAQAEQARKTDLPLAKSLADRADLLARDLVTSTR